MNITLQQEIESLRKLKTKELKRRYLELFGEASRSSNHQHLFRRIAWRLQARDEGDLSERARDRAMQLAADVDLRLRAPRGFWKQLDGVGADAERDARLPAVGTVLTRHYQGRAITVTVLKEGFLCDGQVYRSLSAVAHRVTGTRWNGLLFFGLIQRNGR
jgi:erythromycin esterase-like protein